MKVIAFKILIVVGRLYTTHANHNILSFFLCPGMTVHLDQVHGTEIEIGM